MFIIEKIEELEEKYGDLQSKYNIWRRETEEANEEKTQGRIFINCEFAEARESFSEYCGMDETIPFDVMLWCENNYPDDQEQGKQIKRQTPEEYLKEKLDERMYTYLIVKEDFYTGEQSGRKRTVVCRTPMNVGGLYMHLGKGYPGSWRVLEEVEDEEEM